MVINLITFASILHKQASVRSSHEVILTELEKYFTVNFIDYKDIDKLSSISNPFPAPPSSWQTACRTHWPPLSKYLPGCAAGE